MHCLPLFLLVEFEQMSILNLTKDKFRAKNSATVTLIPGVLLIWQDHTHCISIETLKKDLDIRGVCVFFFSFVSYSSSYTNMMMKSML